MNIRNRNDREKTDKSKQKCKLYFVTTTYLHTAINVKTNVGTGEFEWIPACQKTIIERRHSIQIVVAYHSPCIRSQLRIVGDEKILCLRILLADLPHIFVIVEYERQYSVLVSHCSKHLHQFKVYVKRLGPHPGG